MGVRVGVAELFDDGGDGGGEAVDFFLFLLVLLPGELGVGILGVGLGENVPVDADGVGPEHYHRAPDLPLLDRIQHVPRPDLVGVGDAASARAGFESQAVNQELLLVLVKEFGGFRAIREAPPHHEGAENRDETFEDKDPLPAIFAGNALHLLDGESEKTGEGTGERGSDIEDGHTLLDFVPQIPQGKKIGCAGEEAGFADTEEETGYEKSFIGGRKAHEACSF